MVEKNRLYGMIETRKATRKESTFIMAAHLNPLEKEAMVSRSGYYKWKTREPNPRQARREQLIELVQETHEAHKSHGYRWVAAYIRLNNDLELSDNFVFKIFHILEFGRKQSTKEIHKM